MIGLLPMDLALAEARGAASEGVRAFQVKGGRDPKHDVSLITRLRHELGEDIHLRLDANGGYQRRDLALRTVSALADAGVDLIEQPILGLQEMVECRRTSRVPLMADESCWTPADALEVVGSRAADALSVYVGKAGGLGRARSICAIAEAARLPHDVNGALELGIGNAANLHLALASPAVLLPCVIPVSAAAGEAPTKIAGHYSEDDVIRGAFAFEDDSLVLPDAPGLGIEVDTDKVERYAISRRESRRQG
jgi:muconate cycloisomerase